MTETEIKAIWQETKLFLFDMDGTIYLGDRVFDFARSFISHLREAGKELLFFTNNASHNPDVYYERLTKMGFAPKKGEVMTSGDVTIRFLNEKRRGKAVYLVGTPELEEQFSKEGIPLSETADIVVTSFDTTLTYQKMETACRLIRNGAEYLCTHPDYNCPTEDGYIPDSGAIAAFVTASTGVSPTYFGKPYSDAVAMIGEARNVRPHEICVFGDRLYTDIAFGCHNGCHSVLVLTGESTKEQAQALPKEDRPEIILPSLADADRILFGTR